MALGIFDNSTQGAILVFSLVALPVCTFVTFLRFVSTRRAGRKIGFEDWFALGALIAFIAHDSMSLVVLFMLDGGSFTSLSLPNLLLAGKLNYAIQPCYWLNQSLAKLSIIFLYYRVFSVNRMFVIWIYGIGFVHTGFTTATILITLFGCQPIAKGWDAKLPGSCVTTAPHPFLAGTESINSTVDFAMVILAGFMVQRLSIKASTKWKLSILFALGGLAGVIGFVKIGEYYATTVGGASKAINVTLGLWAVVQQACSIICCSAPIYKNLLPPDTFFRRLASHAYDSLTSWTKGSRSLRSKTSRSFRHGSSEQHRGKSSHSSDSQKQGWLQYDRSGKKGFAGTEVNADRQQGFANYQMKTLQVHQSVEMV